MYFHSGNNIEFYDGKSRLTYGRQHFKEADWMLSRLAGKTQVGKLNEQHSLLALKQ